MPTSSLSAPKERSAQFDSALVAATRKACVPFHHRRTESDIEAAAASPSRNPDASNPDAGNPEASDAEPTPLALLAEREHRFRSAFEDAPVGMAITTLDGRYIEVNAALARILGRRRSELLGMRWQDVTHPEDVGLSSAFVEEAVARARGYEVEKRYVKPDGTVVQALLHVSVVVDAEGRPEHLVAHVQDVTRRREIDRALHASEERFRFLAASSPVGILLVEPDGRCVYANDRFGDLTGVDAHRALGDGWLEMAAPDFRPDLTRRWKRAAARRSELELQVPGNRPECWLRFRARPTHPGGDEGPYVATVEDVTASVQAARDAAEARTLLGAIVDATTDLVAVIHPDGHPVQVNTAGRRLVGVGPQEPIESFSVLDFFTEESRQRILDEVLPRLEAHDVWEGELTILSRDGSQVPMSHVVHAHRGASGSLEFVSTIARDISERKALEAFLAHQALHDPLTGLANRALFVDRLALAAARGLRSGRQAAVLFLDLDHFKDVNDSLGHAVGDRVLVVVSERVREVVRPADTVARLGGDEFGILCEDLASEAEAAAIAGRLRDHLSAPIEVADQQGDAGSVAVGASIGIAYLTPGAEPDDVMRNADAAMYAAKEHGRGRVEVFRPVMRVRAGRRFTIESELRTALDEGSIRPWYQPIVSLRDGAIVGYEALARWHHPERGILLPDEFMGVAEDSGLAVSLGTAMLDQVAADLEVLQGVVGRPTIVWVNVSETQLRRAAFLESLPDRMQSRGPSGAGTIGVEVHESLLSSGGGALVATVAALAADGVPVAVDDFGAAGGRLLTLPRFPFTSLKLDGEVVRATPSSRELRALSRAVVAAAHDLGCQVVAEGVEEQGQMRVALELGCDAAQGFHTGRPRPIDEIGGA